MEALERVGCLGEKVKVVKVGCPHCSELLLVEVKPGLNLLRCACGGYFLLHADANNDVRSVRSIEVEKPLATGRLRLARPELWPKTLEHLRSDVAKALRGEVFLGPAALKAVKLLLELGVLEAEGGG